MSDSVSRRQFLQTTALAAGALAIGTACQQVSSPNGAPSASAAATAQPKPAPAPAAPPKRTASDIVTLGNTGLKTSRLGLGLGSNNGATQAAMGAAGFNAFIKHAFDNGITLLDTAQNYRTFSMLGAAIKGLPREKICIQCKIEQPNNVLATIDNHRKTFNTDYVDSMLVHIQYRANWVDTWKKAMDDFNAAQDKKWILTKGVSCHSLPALRASIEDNFTQLHLVRVNQLGYRIDSEQQVSWGNNGNPIDPVMTEIKKIADKNRAIVGMKIFGNGEMKSDEDREKCARFAMDCPHIHSVIIGFANIAELDKGIALINKVLVPAA